MSVSKVYSSKEIEDKWYNTWLEKKLFKSEPNPDKEPYTVVIPPPNVTGVLHMGHMLNNTIQDILVRKARMEGKEACWVPGTDHASIATETKVVNLLAEQGIKKTDLSREEFLGHAFEWKEKYGGIILDQLKKLGASCDWDRTAFTMDEIRSESVIKVFCKLYEKGLIYRGVRMVNWDPKGLTALSDEEVNHKEVNSKLFYIKYPIVGSDEFITIATTRPETMMGDTAICLNPNDERYTHLHGKKIIVPIVNREIPIILDEYVDLEFGTGCLKVTPAHDINDYGLGLKHNLEVIDVIADDGTMSENAQVFVGENRFVCRKKVIKQLKELDLFEKDEDIKNNVGYSERTNEVIEPKLSTQWSCKMANMAKPALEQVMSDKIQIHPPKFKNMYRSWMENVKDWCVSRQLWWGHQIPAYYLPNGEFVVGETKEVALEKAKAIDASYTEKDLSQDEDVLDTWFSSWLWPMSVFDGINNPDNEEINYYYPTNDLVTGFDIIFFWVARMIMAGEEFRGELPFKNVYITGMVRDEKGRKMSKQLGNSPDPIELMNKYSADGVRVGMLFAAPAGNDLLFNEKYCEQGRNFTSKIWNSFRLTQGWEVENSTQPEVNVLAIDWINSKFNDSLASIQDKLDKFRLSDALMDVYKLIYDDFCAWYLEMVKPDFGKPIDSKTYESTIDIFEKIIKMIHPFMPFISEELYASVRGRAEGDYCIIAEYPKVGSVDVDLLNDIELITGLITNVRKVRNTKGLSPKESLVIAVKTSKPDFYKRYEALVNKLANISSIDIVSEKVENSVSFLSAADEVYVLLGETVVDEKEEREATEAELKYQKGFLISVNKKLSNERFVQNAPEQVIAIEKKKKAEAEAKIITLEESLKSFS